MTFDPHTPEIELMMHQRAQAQGDTVRADGHVLNRNPERMRAVAAGDEGADELPRDEDMVITVIHHGSMASAQAFFWREVEARINRSKLIVFGQRYRKDDLYARILNDPTLVINVPPQHGRSHFLGGVPMVWWDDPVKQPNPEPKPEVVLSRAERCALAVKRHGAAATCPRHGPTNGGLCRKCQR